MHPILIGWGSWHISTYGFFVALGYLTVVFWLKGRMSEIAGMTEDKFWIMIYSMFFGGVLGGKLMFVALNWRSYASGQLHWLKDFRYGFVYFGGFLGSWLATSLALRRIRVPYWIAADYIGAAIPLGHWIGRLGCFGVGCCYGKPTTSPWGVVFHGSPFCAVPPRLWGVPLHPTQLYEAAGDLAIAGALLYGVLPKVKQGRLRPGTVFLAYLVLYSATRFGVEFLRGDDRGGVFASLFISQWISLALLAAAAALLAVRGLYERRP
ncbi:MAG: prolipoprotein diacylglyceryl transferase [Elusimicrobia bacterium]|nr:prolipoprotein diacylglyceryl transferase [Elusimicrobiota bacterium]